mgnify:CR=1 FL=1
MNEKLKQTPPSPESTKDKISRLLDEVHNKIDLLEFNEKRFNFAQKIRKNNPDYQQYRSYHQLDGSHFPKEYDIANIIEGDFDGDCSIVSFLEELLNSEKNKNVAG